MSKGQKIEIGGKTPYQKWIEAQGIPVIRDFYIEDLRKVELAPWKWKGGQGAYLNLIGTGDIDDRFNADPDSFSGKGESYALKERQTWDTNFIPDVRSLPLFSWEKRGAGGSNIMIELAQNSMGAHISQFPVGTYKKAHRHGPG